MPLATLEREVPNDSAYDQAPQSVEIASRGLRTTRDVCQFGSALCSDIMTEKVGHKIGSAAVRAISLTLRTAEFQMRYGHKGKEVVLAEFDAEWGVDQDLLALAQREQELLAELEAVRSQRTAR